MRAKKQYFIIFLIILFFPFPGYGETIMRGIKVEKNSIDLGKNETADLSWELSEAAALTVYICDIHGNLVRTLLNKEKMALGKQQISWDGRDDTGLYLGDGLYFPIIRAKSKRKGIEVYNPTTEPWGEDIIADPIGWDKKKQAIFFSIDKTALCRIRVFIKDGGPMYKAITGWQLYLAGNHEEPWNGMDLNGVVRVTDQKNYQVGFDGFSLPSNSIFLLGSETPPGGLKKDYKKYPIHPPHGRNVAYLTAQPDTIAPDPLLTVQLQADGANIKGKVTILTDLQPGLSPAYQLREDYELYLFVDGVLDTEINRATLPQTLIWDSSRYANGEHIFTINILSTADRAATYSQKVRINN